MISAIVCKLVSILATIIGYMTYRPNDLDSAVSIQTTDSRGPLSLTVNDDRSPNEIRSSKNELITMNNQTSKIYDNDEDKYAGSPTRL
uniref:Solute carrier organic anion transporter family member n=1 Tax=Panagrolaimus sp. JU765 TaxID=591449 RepID=A0AC34QJP5_9BILA